MTVIHFLNVKQGDCSIIEHPSGRNTVIDVCNASPPNVQLEKAFAAISTFETGSGGNHQQKKYPVNPISYMQDRELRSIFRFVLTHPDMDHMDGIRALYQAFPWPNFWDTDNTKELDPNSWQGSPYHASDWQFYKHIRDHRPISNPKRLALLSGYQGPFYNQSYTDATGMSQGLGDGIAILAPTQQLVDEANLNQDFNDCSYVILLFTGNHRVVLGGDSHDKTWEYILQTYGPWLKNIDLLIAPHHGRRSGRSYEFLDVLRPKMTFFGNARSEHLAYSAWNYRNLPHITNNQAGCMIAEDANGQMAIYVTHENYAKKVNPTATWHSKHMAWYIGTI